MAECHLDEVSLNGRVESLVHSPFPHEALRGEKRVLGEMGAGVQSRVGFGWDEASGLLVADTFLILWGLANRLGVEALLCESKPEKLWQRWMAQQVRCDRAWDLHDVRIESKPGLLG